MLAGPVTFRFLVQFQKDAESMPLDDATLELPQRDVDAPGQERFGENLSFTAWHSLEAHSPVGSLQDLRKVVYEASATLRRNANGIPLVEPRSPRP